MNPLYALKIPDHIPKTEINQIDRLKDILKNINYVLYVDRYKGMQILRQIDRNKDRYIHPF